MEVLSVCCLYCDLSLIHPLSWLWSCEYLVWFDFHYFIANLQYDPGFGLEGWLYNRRLTIIIALYRDETKLHTFRGSQASKSSIDIYSCAGKLIRRINWDKGSIKGLGWSEDEKLLVITRDGTVRCYYDLQGDFTQFSLGHGSEEFGVVACRYVTCFDNTCRTLTFK